MTELGRPTVYTREIADEIISRLSAGESLASICAGEDMPPSSTVRGWNTDDRDGFSARYARARLDCVYSRLDAAHDNLVDSNGKTYIDEGGNRRVDSGAVQLARTYADLVKWEASKLIPEFVEKKQIEHSGGIGVAVQAPPADVESAMRKLVKGEKVDA